MENKRLRLRRLELHLTLNDVADAVGVCNTTVSRWENGDISSMRCDKVSLLADVLHVSPMFILGFDDDTPTSTKADSTSSHTSISEDDMSSVVKTLVVACSYLSIHDQKVVLKYATELLNKG